MLRLRTFGGLTLVRDGDVITGAPTQRRQLALLALLAVAGDEGVSRDKILAYLWPEKDIERARHLLNQLLYVQRNLGEAPDVFEGRKTLRLLPQLVQSDVQTFEAALAAGHRDEAVEAYRGPFLDGFFLNGASTFEDWVISTRDRFAHLYLQALDQLAIRATEAGEYDKTLEWRRRAVGADPLDSRLVAAHVEALLLCGNRAGARRALLSHRDRLKKELGMDPDRQLTQLEARIVAAQ